MRKTLMTIVPLLLVACYHHSYPVPDTAQTAMISGDGIVFKYYNGKELKDAQANGEILHVPLGTSRIGVNVGAYTPHAGGGYRGYSATGLNFSYNFDCAGDWDAKTGCMYTAKFAQSSKGENGVNIYKFDLTNGMMQGYSGASESWFVPFD